MYGNLHYTCHCKRSVSRTFHPTVHHFLKSIFTPQQTQIPDYAELIVKFLEALIDSYLPAADEERGEEQLRTPTSPYPPTSQSQLSITANLNLSNSMTSLATSQHSPGLTTHTHTQPHPTVNLCMLCVCVGEKLLSFQEVTREEMVGVKST